MVMCLHLFCPGTVMLTFYLHIGTVVPKLVGQRLDSAQTPALEASALADDLSKAGCGWRVVFDWRVIVTPIA